MQEADIRLAIENHLQNAACFDHEIIWENFKFCEGKDVDKIYWFGKWFPNVPVRLSFDCVEYRGFYEVTLSYPLNGCGPRDADLAAECLKDHFGCFETYQHQDQVAQTTTSVRLEIPYRLAATEDRNRYEVLLRIPYKACQCKC